MLERWEDFTVWLLGQTGRWPKNLRFTLAQRVENHALDIVEHLVVARYEPGRRRGILRRVNLVLERMRHLLRIALRRDAMTPKSFETAQRGIDDCGRAVGAWKKTLDAQSPRRGRRPRHSRNASQG